MSKLVHRFRHQFHQPSGAFGVLAGWRLAAKGDRALPMLDAAALTPDDHVLDIGCGPGVALARASRIATRGRVVGIDPSDVMLRQSRRRTRRAANVAVDHASAESIPLADASIDVAWALNTFHHWVDRDRGLAEVRRVLRPRGRFLVVEQHRHGRTGVALDDDDASALATRIREAGFDVVEVRNYEGAGETHTLVRAVRGATA